MTGDRLFELLAQLLPAHSPGGDEGELDRILLPYFRDCCRGVRQDAAENLTGVVRGTGERRPIIVAAHKDELGMIVKRLEPDGGLRVEPLGGIPPWKYGEGPVDILAPGGPVPGIMSVGSLHTTEETPLVEQARRQPLTWRMVRIFACRTRAELEALGIGAGTRVVVARERKGPVRVGDCVCGFGLDDKAALAVMLDVMQELAGGPPPPQDVYFVATSTEEQMGCGGTFAADELPPDTMLS